MALAIYLGGRERRGGTREAQISHTLLASERRRFFYDFSDAFLEWFWVDFGVPFGAILSLKRVQMTSKIDAEIDTEKRMKNYGKRVKKRALKG